MGNYKIERVLGVGGFGITYLGEHLSLSHPVAVKEYLPNEFAVRDGATVQPKSATDQNAFDWGRARFLDEARMLTRFRHPNIVRVSDYFEANNTAYIVMDYEDGQPLDILLEQHGTLTETQLRRVVLPVADGLRQVHAAGCLHRDIKPANIFVRRADESPVLLDFGAARQALGRKSRSITAIASAGYSPPEQYENNSQHQGPWSDIYALSAVCYRAITGQTPIEAIRRQGQLLRTQTDPLQRLDHYAPRYAQTILDIVERGMHLVETERPQQLGSWIDAWPIMADSTAGFDDKYTQPTKHTQSTRVAALKRRAINGSWAAQSQLANMYSLGTGGVVKDMHQAAIWQKKAAEQGRAMDQLQLGIMYQLGHGVPKDGRKAISWYEKAAAQDFSIAEHMLGKMYAGGGAGVPKDFAKAVAWYRPGAERGNSTSQFFLGEMYHKGEGVPKDVRQAVEWYKKRQHKGIRRRNTHWAKRDLKEVKA